MRYFSHFWLVTAAHAAKEGILALCDGNGDVAAEVIEDSFSFGYADVYVQLLRGEPTVGALELTKIAPALGYLTSHYYDDESKKTKVKLLRGETMFVPGDSGSPILDQPNGRVFAIQAGGNDGNKVEADQNFGVTWRITPLSK